MRDDSSDSSTKKKIVLKGLPLDQIWINTFVKIVSDFGTTTNTCCVVQVAWLIATRDGPL